MFKRIIYIFLVILSTSSCAYSQVQRNKDSLRTIHYFSIFQKYEYVDTLKARRYADSAVYYANKSKSNYLIGRAHQFKGWYFQDCSRFKESNKEFYLSLAFLKKTGNKQAIADAYGNLGNSYLDMREYQKSLDYQHLSLAENEKIISRKPGKNALAKAKEGRAIALHNIATLYQDLGLPEKALEYEYKAVAHDLETNDKVGVAISYYMLASIHESMNHADSAIHYFKKSLELYRENDYPMGMAASLQAYASMENTGLSEAKRKEMILESLKIRQELGDVDGELKLLIEIGESQFDNISSDSLSRMLEHVYLNIKAYELEPLWEKYFHLYARYNSRIGKFDSAYFALKNFLELKAISDEKKYTNDLVAQDIRFQWETKNYNDSLKLEHSFAKERLRNQEDLNTKQNYIYLGVIGIIIALSTLFYFMQSNRRKKRLNDMLSLKNELIQEQKVIVDERNKSISDSINYAQRLQNAILPTPEMVNQCLPQSFLVFRPKDVVSGDFHWFEMKDDIVFVASADCTGHGVPGAMVSVVCSNAMNTALNGFGLKEPNEILDKTRELVIDRFEKNIEHVVDGMDIGLCAVHFKEKTLVYAGANNPLWLVRRNEELDDSFTENILKGEKVSLIEIKGDRQPVGQHVNMKPFRRIEISLHQGDIIYLLTDGFADQFGGPQGKKFRYAPLKQVFLDLYDKNLKEQKAHLEKLFDDWKGDLEQVDDLCIIGFRVD